MSEGDVEILKEGGEWLVLIPNMMSVAHSMIAIGSAVVVHENRWNALVKDGVAAPVYYEGGIYGKMSFAEKLLHAAGRAKHKAPTVAMMGATSAEDFFVAGRYDLDRQLFWPNAEHGDALGLMWGVSDQDKALATAAGILGSGEGESVVAISHKYIGGVLQILVRAGNAGADAIAKMRLKIPPKMKVRFVVVETAS